MRHATFYADPGHPRPSCSGEHVGPQSASFKRKQASSPQPSTSQDHSFGAPHPPPSQDHSPNQPSAPVHGSTRMYELCTILSRIDIYGTNIAF